MNNTKLDNIYIALMALAKKKSCNLIMILSLANCSPDIDEMSLYERALHHKSRYSADRSEDNYHKPFQLLDFIELSSGDRVVDLMGGGGYFTELFSYIVGDDGVVYIHNNKHFLHYFESEITKRLSGERLSNVIRLDNEFSKMELPDNIDIIFIGQGYHNIYVPRDNPDEMVSRDDFLAQLYRSLKLGGKVIIIENAAQPGTGIKDTHRLHRIDEVRVKDDMTKAGFQYMGAMTDFRNQDDNYNLDIWHKTVFKKTDRFVHKYIKQ